MFHFPFLMLLPLIVLNRESHAAPLALTIEELAAALNQASGVTQITLPPANETIQSKLMENCMKFEGDIRMDNLTVDDYGNGMHMNDPNRQNTAIKAKAFHWTNKEVPYRISSSVSKRARDAIARAVVGYAKDTCIKFVPKKSSDKNYLEFISDDGCWSYVGKQGGKQQISIDDGCELLGIVQHEMLHALGFFHEQSRADRDQFVEVKWDNIARDMESNFRKYDLNYITHLGAHYDYNSVMHYGRYSFSKNGQPTLVPKNGNPKIGQRQGLSDIDIAKVNKLYDCPEPDECRDIMSECTEWAKEGHCEEDSEHFQTASDNCKKSCGICEATTQTATRPSSTVSTTPVPSVVDCADTLITCHYLASAGYCTALTFYRDFVVKSCKKSCNICKNAEPECRDKKSNCTKSRCGRHSYVKRCKKTCDACTQKSQGRASSKCPCSDSKRNCNINRCNKPNYSRKCMRTCLVCTC